MADHDRHSTICQREMLSAWRNNIWNKSPISNEVHLANIYSPWPCPDGIMHDPKNKWSIGIEFKPYTENKRGVQTGIGQSITYLNKFSVSYLIIPHKLKNDGNFEISKYLTQVFNNKVRGKMPIGLVGYDYQSMNIEMLVDIELNTNFIEQSSKNVGTYWAFFRDTNPHLTYLALEISNQYAEISDNRKEAVWKLFFDKYYFPIKHRETLIPFESEIDHWGVKKMEPFRDIIKNFNKKINDNELTRKQAISELKQHTFKEGIPSMGKSKQNDNKYKSFKKNYFGFINHLQLWDEDAYLTDLGKQLYNIGKEYGPKSDEFKLTFSKIILVNGKHYDLIQDIIKYSKNTSFTNVGDAYTYIFKKLEDDGLIKRNLNRAASNGATKNIGPQLQLYTKMGILPQTNRYIPKYGIHFFEKKINEIMNFNYDNL